MLIMDKKIIAVSYKMHNVQSGNEQIKQVYMGLRKKSCQMLVLEIHQIRLEFRLDLKSAWCTLNLVCTKRSFFC